MKGKPTSAWAKLTKKDDVITEWHPLEAHSADVAALVEALLKNTILARGDRPDFYFGDARQ
jgi:CRISPR-associated endonuclease/helicase Cas3